jgi:uncharacterized membrane protein
MGMAQEVAKLRAIRAKTSTARRICLTIFLLFAFEGVIGYVNSLSLNLGNLKSNVFMQI